MEKQCKEEHEILDKIKKKMDRIRDRHNKERNRRSRALGEQSPEQEPAELEQQIFQEPTDHYEGVISPVEFFLRPTLVAMVTKI